MPRNQTRAHETDESEVCSNCGKWWAPEDMGREGFCFWCIGVRAGRIPYVCVTCGRVRSVISAGYTHTTCSSCRAKASAARKKEKAREQEGS